MNPYLFNAGAIGLGWWLATKRSTLMSAGGLALGAYGAYGLYQTMKNRSVSGLSNCPTCTPRGW